MAKTVKTRVVPQSEINTGPRDERGKLKPGEPRAHEERLADTVEDCYIELSKDVVGLLGSLSPHDTAMIVEALRAKPLFDEAIRVCQMVSKSSMGSTSPMRGESSIGWQRSDGVDKYELLDLARKLTLAARALKSE